MSAAEKRMRAHFKHYPEYGSWIRSITTSEGEFPLFVKDIKFAMGERRRTCRELAKLVEEFEAETDSDCVSTEWLKRWLTEVAKL